MGRRRRWTLLALLAATAGGALPFWHSGAARAEDPKPPPDPAEEKFAVVRYTNSGGSKFMDIIPQDKVKDKEAELKDQYEKDLEAWKERAKAYKKAHRNDKTKAPPFAEPRPREPTFSKVKENLTKDAAQKALEAAQKAAQPKR